MNIRQLLLGTLAVACFAAAAVASPPNVLFITVDDLNDWPKSMGVYPSALTPHIDRLAQDGTLFRRAYAQYPICAPSRASFMSGLRPSTLGLTAGNIADTTLPEIVRNLNGEFLHSAFARAGYKTMAIGKIFHHHVPPGTVEQSGGREPGFSGKRQRLVWHQIGTLTDWGVSELREEDMSDVKSAAWAAERLAEPHDRPFFMMVGFLRPHVPWYVPQRFFDRIPKDVVLPPYDSNDLFDLPPASITLNRRPEMPTTEWAIQNDRWKEMVRAYLASMAFVDDQVGKVLEALRASKYGDNTIVVLLSDHGYHLGEKDRFQKHTLWERSLHVPLIFAGARVPKAKTVNDVVSLLDVYPTLLDLCGVARPGRLDGASLEPLLNGRAENWPNISVSSYHDGWSVMTTRYHLIRYADGSGELYDLEKDPNEWTNVFANPLYAEIIPQLTQHIPKTTGSKPPERRRRSQSN